MHTLTIEARDNSGQVTRIVYRLSVVQAPPPEDQLPLLWVDDVYDRASNAWQGAPPQRLPLDNDIYRDDFYLGALTGSGGVVNFDEGRDIVDTEVDSDFDYRDHRALPRGPVERPLDNAVVCLPRAGDVYQGSGIPGILRGSVQLVGAPTRRRLAISSSARRAP